MKFSARTTTATRVAILAAVSTGSLISEGPSVSAFTSLSSAIQSSYATESSTSSSMLVPKKTFDVVLPTKRAQIGYDDESGRFFESKMVEVDTTTSTIITDSSISSFEDTTNADDDTIKPTLLEENEGHGSVMDVPPLPTTASGLEGMEVKGEFEGVKVTAMPKSAVKSSTPARDEEEKGSDDAVKSESNDETTSSSSLKDRLANSGAASAAAMATAAVNAAVSMKTLSAPSLTKSYVSLGNDGEIDEEGLPLAYDKDLIEAYWKKERGALTQRWSYFVGKAVPFLTRLVTLFISDGEIKEKYVPELSRQAVADLQDLGPTFIKLGQMMSVRPDVLPTSTLDELSKLQDAVVPFETEVAVRQIERELGGPLGKFFTSISEEPVAAASLAQVYLATLNDGNDTRVAVKVQRPSVLSTVSKDLYVLRRAAEVFQGLVERFAPQQKTNYVALLNEFAIGFYTELDFANEAKNQITIRNNLIEAGIEGLMVPKVYEDLTTRRILVSEWIDGCKLSECPKEEIADITEIAQEAFLTQLFQDGFFHADPHPGNLLKLNNPTEEGYKVALIDCGLMASIDRTDRDNMISAVIHLANKDYASLVDDFIKLEILPKDCDRPTIIPLMDKALSPYVKGGGAKKYEEELKKLYGMENTVSSTVGGFQAMTQDALTVLNDVPFSIPPYFAILGRAIVTLEGIALIGNPDYGIIMESYPFIARKLLAEDRPEIQSALQEVLFSAADGSSNGLQITRLLALLNNASGAVGTKDGAAFVDLDAIPEEGLGVADGVKLLLSEKSESLRGLLEAEVDNVTDIISRQVLRKGMTEAVVALTPPRPPSLPFIGDVFSALPRPQLDEIPIPFLLPGGSKGQISPTVSLLTANEFTDLVAPKLSRDEEIYAISIADAAEEFLGPEVANFIRGDGLISTKSAQLVLSAATSGLLGRNDVLGTDGAQNFLRGLSNLLGTLDRNDDGQSKVDEIISESLSQLSDDEKVRLEAIVEELAIRGLERMRVRVAERVVA